MAMNLSPAGAALSGMNLTAQVGAEADDERRRRLLAQQQKQLLPMSSGAASLGLSPAGYSAAGLALGMRGGGY
jgi:hypothetical protein